MTWLIVIGFVAFACSLPFEAALLLGGEGLFSISRLIGYGFFALCLLRPGVCFRTPPRAFWWFAIYYGLYVVTGLYQPSLYWPEIAGIIFRLTQFLVLMWVAYNLFRIERVARWGLWGFAIACVLVGALLAIGLRTSEFVVGRQTVFGQGPNTIASLIGLGGVTLIGMAYGKSRVKTATKATAWMGFFVVAVAITRTGSRGALVGLAGGLLTLVASRQAARARMRNALIVVVALAACIWITLTSAATADRWHRTLEEGNVAGRDRIYRAAIWMFVERPIMGWGPATNYYELGRRLGLPKRDTHNLVLWLLTEQGIVGSIPFAIGLWLCIRASWRGRKSIQGQLPFALVVAVLFVNMSGTYYVTKWFWFFMAYALASETYLPRRTRRHAVPSAARPRLARQDLAAVSRTTVRPAAQIPMGVRTVDLDAGSGDQRRPDPCAA